MPSHFGNHSKWVMVSFLTQASHKTKRTGNFLHSWTIAKSIPSIWMHRCSAFVSIHCTEITDLQFWPCSCKRIRSVLFWGKCHLMCSGKIPQGHMLFNDLLQSLELLSFVVKVYCLSFASGALGLTGHTPGHTHGAPLPMSPRAHHFCTQSSSSVTLLYSLLW